MASASVYGQSDTLDIYDMDLGELSRIKITSASKVSEVIMEVPSSVFVLSERDIRLRGYLTLDDVLSDLPGFQFRNIQSINSYIFQRGIPNQNNLTLILIDGVQVNELNSGGFYAGGQYNLANVERIEVIHGPASVAYGTNAISGIINIITKSPDKNFFGGSTQVGSFNTLNSSLSGSYVSDKKPFGIAISGMAKHTDRSDLRGEAGDNNWTDLMDNYDHNYAFDIKMQVGKFLLGTNYLHKQTSGAAYVKSVGTAYKDHGTLWNLRFINNYLKYNARLSESALLTSMIYSRNSTVLPNSVLYVTDTDQIGYYRPNHLIGVENIVLLNLIRSLSVATGVVFEYEQLADGYAVSLSGSPDVRPQQPGKPAMLNNTLASIFVEPRINPLPGLYVSGGVRFDHSSIYDQVFTPRLGISYQLQNHVARISYAEAFRAPKPWDFFDGLGNPGLLPERMNSLEAGMSLMLSSSLKADLSAYQNELENAITRHDVEGGYYWTNRGAASINGFEVTLRHLAPRLNTYINYTYTDSRDEHGQPITEISKHTANAGFTFNASNNLSLHLRANYGGERENPSIIASTGQKFIDPYLVMHSSVTYTNLWGFDVQLSVRNLFDAAYYHTSNRDPDRYRQPQRTVLLGIAYTLQP